MSTCSFSLAYSSNAAELIHKAKQAITQTGGVFTGDIGEGSFELKTPLGLVKGSYTVTSDKIQMQITHKPLLLSCGRIEEELRRRMNP